MVFDARIEVSAGRSLHVRDEGGGEPVLLLHGFTGSGATMAALAETLLPEHRVVSVDLMGHGESDAPRGREAYALERCCQDLKAVLDARGIEHAHLLGYSMGARIGLGFALEAPERVLSFVGIGTRAGIADPAARATRRTQDDRLAAEIEARGIAWFVDYWMALPIFSSQSRLGAEALEAARKQRQRNRSEGLAGSLRGVGAGSQPSLFEALPRLQLPVLLVTGAEDVRFTQAARELGKWLPDAKLEVLPDAGHAAHLENPAAFQAAWKRHRTRVSAATSSPEPGSLGAWHAAARPATLPASLVPVAVGTAVAVAQEAGRFVPAMACLTAAVSLQLATNFVNDYADFERGTDDEDRLGPPRAAQQGWLTPSALRIGAGFALGLAALVGLYGIAVGGWPIAVAGALALLCAWAYTGGPYPLGYHGFGDPLVFIFFGGFAVVGTHWLQAGAASSGAFASALPLGFLATALIAVNNLRDRPTDVAAGKRTVAVRLGERRARRYTAGLVLAAYGSLPLIALAGAGWLAALPLATIPLAIPVLQAIRDASGRALNNTLARTGRLELAFGAALVASWGAVAWMG